MSEAIKTSKPEAHSALWVAVAVLCASLSGPARAVTAPSAASQPAAPAADSGYKRSEAAYVVPDVTVVRQDGKKFSFNEQLDDGRPVFLNFVFASCTTICPILSHIFSQVQTRLGPESERVHLVSISIDPENDTPEKLLDYAKKVKAGPSWDHFTGSAEASIAIQKAFKAFRGDKMNHLPLIFLRPAPGKPWIRLDGLVSADDVIREHRAATESK